MTELQQMIDTLRGRDDDKLCLDAADQIEELASARLMTARDCIALGALSGMLAHATRYRPRKEGQDWHEAIAEEAYEIAEAMVTHRHR